MEDVQRHAPKVPINIDRVYTLDHFVAPGETEAADAFALFPGGKGFNQSIALARAGAPVTAGVCPAEAPGA